MNLDFDKVLQFINGLYGLPKGSLVFIWCLIFGRIIKGVSWIHNSSIPLLVVANGGISLLLLSDFRSSSIESVNVYVGTNVIVGFIIGGLSTIIYRFAWKPLLAKFGVKDDSTPPFPNVPGAIVPPTTEPPKP